MVASREMTESHTLHTLYLLLSSLKIVILAYEHNSTTTTTTTTTTNSSSTDFITSILHTCLLSLCTCTDEAVRGVVADCLGEEGREGKREGMVYYSTITLFYIIIYLLFYLLSLQALSWAHTVLLFFPPFFSSLPNKVTTLPPPPPFLFILSLIIMI